MSTRRFLMVLLGWALLAPAVPAWPADKTAAAGASTPVEAAPYGHLQYFGFYASAMFDWNFTQQLAPHTNLTWIHVGTADAPLEATMEIMDRLREAREAGVSAVISIEPFLFRDDEGHPRTAQEIEDFLVELRARIENEDLLPSVAMIYPVDEPFRNFRRARDPSFIEQYVTGEVYEDIHQDLHFVNAQVKLVFPEVPLGVILAGSEIFHDFFSIPENYDWVGFDCYTNLFRGCDDRSHVRIYHRLLAHMQAHQRLMAVPETWVQTADLGRPGWAETLLQRLQHHYEIALSEPRFVAFIPFIWSFDVAEGIQTPGVGLNRVPEWFDDGLDDPGSAFLEAVLDIGRQIKTGSQSYPNLDWSQTEAHPARPPSRLEGAITGVSDDGLVSGWALDWSLPHKNLRVELTVRDYRGRIYLQSDRIRTFLRDDSLEQLPEVDQPLIGTHAFEVQIPRAALKALRYRPSWGQFVWLRVYADGESGSPVLVTRIPFRSPNRYDKSRSTAGRTGW